MSELSERLEFRTAMILAEKLAPDWHQTPDEVYNWAQDQAREEYVKSLPVDQKCSVIVDGAHGIYVPQLFIQQYEKLDGFNLNISDENRASLHAGPDDEWYWDAFQSCLDNCELVDENDFHWRLHQDGDLFLIMDGFDPDNPEGED